VPSVFEILEHTADIGIRVHGSTLSELFANAAQGLQSLALETGHIESKTAYPLSATGEDLESLLVNWLNEILYFLDGERVAFAGFDIAEITEESIAGQGWGEPRDRQRHAPRLVVKAATYHQLRVTSSQDGWTAEVFFDI
jgi:SHS2 domain-containing protein